MARGGGQDAGAAAAGYVVMLEANSSISLFHRLRLSVVVTSHGSPAQAAPGGACITAVLQRLVRVASRD